MTLNRRPPTDPSDALAQYRRRAAVYDLELALFEPVRQRAIERLGLQTGEVAFDVGCGTGLSLALLQRGVGAQGHIVGIEQSPEMMAQASQRMAQQHWRNVTLLQTPAESAPFSYRGDAALFHFTHDILRAPSALAHVINHLRPGARVVACGLQWVSPWLWPVNCLVLPAALHSVSSLEGLDRPWSLLEALVDVQSVETLWLGAVYVARGVVPRKRRPK